MHNNYCKKDELLLQASVAILPMGTGNDLARALGWGAGCSDLNAHSIIHSVKEATPQILDRYYKASFIL